MRNLKSRHFERRLNTKYGIFQDIVEIKGHFDVDSFVVHEGERWGKAGALTICIHFRLE